MSRWNGLKGRIKRSLNRWRAAGRNHECLICGFQASYFLPSGLYKRRAGAKCPDCNSLERHRHMAQVLEQVLPELAPKEVIHFAAEACFQRFFGRHPEIRYRTSHFNETVSSDLHLDLEAIDLPDASCDLVMCSHVLEHVGDDRLAMRELLRILRPGGVALLQVPMWPSEAHPTYENPAVTDPRDRIIHFGQFDHVRIYGIDFVDRLEECGFEVEIQDAAASNSPAQAERLGLVNSTGIRNLTFLSRRPEAGAASPDSRD